MQWLRSSVVAAFAALAFAFPVAVQAQDGIQRQKAWLKIDHVNLALLWNGDKGEAGRGNGEVYVTAWIYWPCDVEYDNPQQKSYGPLGGDVGFPSGTLVQQNPPDGPWSIQPAVVPVVGNAYFNEANCPVAPYVVVEVFVWESDCNKKLNDYVKAMKDAIDSAAEDASDVSSIFAFVQVVTAGIAALIDILTTSSDDEIGRFSGFMAIPDPCAGPFVAARSLSLETLCAALWEDVDAEAASGDEFGDPPYNLDPPANIGSLQLLVLGGLVNNKVCTRASNEQASTATTQAVLDVGQPDEATIRVRTDLGAALSHEPNGVVYATAFDVDADLATGSTLSWALGAEYLAKAWVVDGGGAVGHLEQWSDADQAFSPIPVPLHEASVDPSRMAVMMAVERAALGIDAAEIAVRGLVLDGFEILDALPGEDQPALLLAVNGTPTGVPPWVIDSSVPHDGRDVPIDAPIRIRFSKTMDRIATLGAVTIQPFVPFTASWSGDVLAILPSEPLKHGENHLLLISPEATDTVGTPLDGNGDGKPGDPFLLPFRTAHRPMPTLATDGTSRSEFIPGEPFLVLLDAIPPGQPSLVFTVLHDPIAVVPGAALLDVSSDGPNPIIANDSGFATVPVGSIGEPGEYNIVFDANGNGIYEPPFDRIDRSGIGFAVLPDCDGSGVADAVEIAAGILADSDGDGTPDICEAPKPCPGDLVPDGEVNGADLGVLLGGWGPCAKGCVADIDGNGIVDAADLAILLGAWGPCSG